MEISEDPMLYRQYFWRNIVNHTIYRFLSKKFIRNQNDTTSEEPDMKEAVIPSLNNGKDDFPYEIKIFAENLKVPWAIAISDDGKLYVTERTGTIRVIEEGKLREQPLITFDTPFVSQGEGGLLGIALDPAFSQNHYLYVMHSYMQGDQIFNRVVRLLENNNTATIDKIIINQIPGGAIHNGGRIKIGPDKKLYITTGDAGKSSLSQDMSSYAGKILRINLDGSIPDDNPFKDSPVYSLGFRNPQGLTWNSQGMLYATDHGSSAKDEINLILPGGNYGWPLVEGEEESSEIDVQRPIIYSGNETWAPSGIAFLQHGPWKGRLLVATLRGEKLLVMTINNKGTRISNVESFLVDRYGRLREVVEEKYGSIYITTSNRDGRGVTDVNDDKIVVLIPKK